MKKTLLCIILALISIFSFTFVACKPSGDGGDNGPVANAELDEYNQIVDQIKDAFTQTSLSPQLFSKKGKSAPVLFSSSQQDIISDMFLVMSADPNKQESEDMDYYAYGIDFSTMTARIAGYAANNYFKVSSFYGLNFLMEYGGQTVINASVEKEDDIIKTYLFTTFKNSQNQTCKEYNYTEMRFASKTDFDIIVVDYGYNEQDGLLSQTMIYASSEKDFILLSGDVDQPNSGMVFFDKGENHPAYMLQAQKSTTVGNLLSFMSQNFALSSQEKNYIGSLYNTQDYSINYEQVVQAKTDLGIIINMDDEDYVPPIGFVSNKNADDLVGRKTLQAFVDDGESVSNKTLTIPSEFQYLSGGIYFQADIDTLVIPSTIKGVVVYDQKWDHSILSDNLCYDDEGNGRYRAWGGNLTSYVLDENGEFHVSNNKPFKKFILLDESGNPTTETDAFVLDQVGNLWIKDSNGNKNYLWGFVSEPMSDTLYLPSPTYVTINNRYIEVEHFYSGNFTEIMKSIGKDDDYTATIKHLIVDGYMVEQEIPEMGIRPGFKLLRNNFLSSYALPDGTIVGFNWNLDTLTINNITNEASVSLNEIFVSVSNILDEYGYPDPVEICQTKIKKVILNGDFESITYTNGYAIYEKTSKPPMEQGKPGQDGGIMIEPDQGFDENSSPKIIETYAISEDYELNGRENAYFSYESLVFGQKVFEVYNDEHQLPVLPDLEKLVIKSSVRELRINDSFYKIGRSFVPVETKLTIEFEYVAGIDFSDFYIYDFMHEDANWVEKIKFNSSEIFMQKILRNMEDDYYSGWLFDAVNSGKYIIEYGNALPGESEFFENYDFDGGFVFVNQSCALTEFVIDQDFLTLVMQMTGKKLDELQFNFGGGSDTNIKLTINVSKQFLDENGGMPYVSNVNIVEIASEMKEFDNLTEIFDRVLPFDESTLIFNGTKQELIARAGDMGEAYIDRLLYVSYSYYKQIVFSDNETIDRGLANKTLIYEDERIKLSITFSNGYGSIYHFEDKVKTGVNYTGTEGNYNDRDNTDTYWCISVSAYEFGYNSIPYENFTIEIPYYEFNIWYGYGETEDYDLIYVYGTSDGSFSMTFELDNLPPNVTIE